MPFRTSLRRLRTASNCERHGELLIWARQYLKRGRSLFSRSLTVISIILFCTILIVKLFGVHDLVHTLVETPVSRTIPRSKPLNQSLNACLHYELSETGSYATRIVTGGNVRTAKYVMVGATATSYGYAKYWQQLRTNEGIPFVYFGTHSLRSGELPAHYGRIPALLAVRNCLPQAEHLIYCDADAILNWPAVCKAADKWVKVGRPLSITWRETRLRRNGMELRTHFFVIHTNLHGAAHILHTWLYNGRHVHVQDQTVINELYGRKRWVRQLVNAVHRRHTMKSIELEHCGSFIAKRATCMKTLKGISEKLQKQMTALHLATAQITNTSSTNNNKQ